MLKLGTKMVVAVVAVMQSCILVYADNSAGRGNATMALVSDGEPNATIVIAAEAKRAAWFAALELQLHVRKITGAELPIVADNVPVEGNRVLIGESTATAALGLRGDAFARQEYLIRFLPDTIVLFGRDENNIGRGSPQDYFEHRGSLFAAYAFLERFCGVRWYLPTDLGITYTPRKTLLVSGQDIRRTPHMTYRWIGLGRPYPADLCGDTAGTGDLKDMGPAVRPMDMNEFHVWMLRTGMGGEPYQATHSFYGYYDRFWNQKGKVPDETWAKWKNWFAEGYTEKRPPQMCYTDPGLIAQVVQDARDFFDGKGLKVRGYGRGDYFSVEAMDGRRWCKCSRCRELHAAPAARGKGRYSNDRASTYWFGFVNKVAREVRKTHPDKYIATLAYSDHSYPPVGEAMEPNVAVTACMHSRYWYDPNMMQDGDLLFLNAWAGTGCELRLWLYYCFPAYHGTRGDYRVFPGFFAHAIVDHMKIFREAGVCGIEYQPSYLLSQDGRWGLQGGLFDQLEYYITWKLADDPDLDGDELIDEFFMRYYGAAAEPMKAFYEMAESIYWNVENHQGLSPEKDWKHLGTPERMTALGGLMERAKRAATTDLEKKRVALFDKGIWQYMRKGRAAYEKQHVGNPLKSMEVPRIAPSTTEPSGVDWGKAGVMTDWRRIDGDPTSKEVEGRLIHDGTNLYLRLVDTTDPKALSEGENFWHSDAYELFFAKERSTPYNHVGIDFKGQYEAYRHGGEEPQPWRSGVSVVSDLNGSDRWTLYVTLPLQQLLKGGVRPGDKLFMNVLRSTAGPRTDAVAWSPTLGGYHAPSRFAEVVLAE